MIRNYISQLYHNNLEYLQFKLIPVGQTNFKDSFSQLLRRPMISNYDYLCIKDEIYNKFRLIYLMYTLCTEGRTLNSESIDQSDKLTIIKQKLIKKENLTNAIALEDGLLYIGEMENGERHGFGILIYPNGSILEGQKIFEIQMKFLQLHDIYHGIIPQILQNQIKHSIIGLMEEHMEFVDFNIAKKNIIRGALQIIDFRDTVNILTILLQFIRDHGRIMRNTVTEKNISRMDLFIVGISLEG